ncbi:hypothetical protein VNO78_30453 [Psophocarpus tetragonolobus]|uniref:Transcription factor n=1 Tax=Psophocarpus tetragonolobus TaxID=3891 RepID=A0AAN9RWS6_PSOTE
METCMTSSLWLATPQSETSRTPPPPAPPWQSQSPLQKRLQTLLDGARESWTYAIFWESAHDNFSGGSLLRWGDGYYRGGEEEKGEAKTTSWLEEQARRKKVLLELNTLIAGPEVCPDDVEEEVTDTVWFFLLSMIQSFVNDDSSLLGQAFFNSIPVWVTGPDRLSELGCQRARQGQVYGLRTLVCIPCGNGVVEVASTEVIFENPHLMNKVVALFNFSNPHALHTHHLLTRKDKKFREKTSTEMQNCENNLSKQSRGKKKMSDDSKCCSWPLLSASSDGGSDSTFSNSDDYSGPS